MKILHLCLASFYIDQGSYQENLLPRYHKRDGYDVEIIASLDMFNSNGHLITGEARKPYLNEDSILVTRLEYKCLKVDRKLKRFKKLFSTLVESKPDIIFIHGCQFWDVYQVVRYLKKYVDTQVFVDNHADFSNSARNILSRYFLHRVLWKFCAQSILPYTQKFYGVLPSRVDFLHEEYEIPRNKIELLVMGADDDLLVNGDDHIVDIRASHSISDKDLLVVTGGKIDSAKREVLELMRAVNEINDHPIKLLVFGSVVPDMQNEFNSLLSSKVQYIGWISPRESYLYFDTSDLVVFPGRHSVFWEQVVAQKKPMMVKRWDGTTHIDIGGNVLFLERSDKKEIKEKLSLIKNSPYLLKSLIIGSQSSKSEDFLYSNISKKSLQNF